MDETTTPRDTSGATSDSSLGEEVTSKQTPETFTKEDVEKAKSDALAKAGRDAKTLKDERERLERMISDFRKERDDAERLAVGDDPDALKSLHARQAQRERDAELDKRERELNERETSIKDKLEGAEQVTKELSARDIASKYGVDAKLLTKFTDGSPEAMEELAQSLPRKASKETSLKPDSGETGGGTGLRVEDVKKMSPEEQNKRLSDIAKLPLS